MKTLLAIVNEPKESKEFLRYVAGMAINQTAQIKVLYAHTPVNYSIGMADTSGYASIEMKRSLEKIVDESTKMLKKYIDEISAEISNRVFTDYSSEIGFAAVIADDLVENNKADMVVM